jgi:sugar O-acyltransferase (sialic acid O-acetyltransferase NeuD family)
MLIIGAGGFAKQLLEVFFQIGEKNLSFYDDTGTATDLFCNRYPVIKTKTEAIEYLKKKDKRFLLGIGGPINRKIMAERFIEWGGEIQSLFSPKAYISNFGCQFGKGINILTSGIIENNVSIADGVLINIGAYITHDCKIGDYTEISPRVTIGGNCRIGDFCNLGTNCTILPKVNLGKNVIVGAGAVVTKDIPDNSLVVGIPANLKKKLSPLKIN